MIIEAPLLLSGVTASPGQMLALSGDILTGISISAGQVISIAVPLTGITYSAGRVVENINIKIAPNIFTLLFGANATQNVGEIIINKNDLTGLTPKDGNTGESLLVGILYRNLLNTKKIFTPKVDFEYWGRGFNDNQQIDTIVVNVYNLLPTTDTYEISDYNSNVSPMDY
jgi:hypothetical protein